MSEPIPDWLTERCTSRGGVPILIRPLRGDDAPRERAFIDGLSPASLYQRLLGTVKEVTDEQIAELVRQDWPRRLGLAAFGVGAAADRAAGEPPADTAGERPAAAAGGAAAPSAEGGLLGVARFDVSDRPGAAEFAIVVTDRWQRHGIGYALFQRLVRAARAAGYRELVGTTYAVNRDMIELARSYGFAVGPEEGEPSLRRLTLALNDRAGADRTR
jgi:acetyltransferase